jgi:hypothetical protein
MGRLEDWQERTDEWAERIDELLRRERRPGEQPPKVLYFTAILTLFVIFILVVYIAFFQGDEGQKTVLDDAPAAPVIPAGSEDCSARDFPGIELTDQDDLPTDPRPVCESASWRPSAIWTGWSPSCPTTSVGRSTRPDPMAPAPTGRPRRRPPSRCCSAWLR